MARGFESKSVADQQESAQNRQRTARGNTGEPASAGRIRKLELARADVLRRMELAHAEPHKEMLRRALAALDKDLAAL
jgi:hypothetical protein